MDDLLKEAIADAKAVRETALQNAKIALEEAFTPRLQSMLSKKIQSEIEGEEEVPYEEDEFGDEEIPAEEDEFGGEVGGGEVEKDIDVAVDDEIPAEEGEFGDEELPAEEGGFGDEELPPEEELAYAEEDEEAELDLESIIKELESEDAAYEEGDDIEDVTAENNDVSSGIGTGDNKQPATKANDDDTDDPGDSTEEQPMGEGVDPEDAAYEEGDDVENHPDLEEVIDLESVLEALKEEDDEDNEEVTAENNKLKSALGEHRKVIKYLKSKLNEVNLLNAKLLFTNKLFKNYQLNNPQKMKVVETFDRANSLREVKLVYSTLAESFSYGTSISKKSRYGLQEATASKRVKSTRPTKKVISEGKELSNRFKKLAGLIK